MKYLDAVHLFKEIEKEYDVMSIKYKGVAIWPYLRIYLFDTLTSNSAVSHDGSAIKLLLSSLFRFNPLRFFKKYRVWNFSSSTTRKKIGNQYEHHVSGYLCKSPYAVLTVEFQSPGIRTPKNSDIPEKNIVSGSWALMMTGMLEILSRPFLKVKLEGEDVLRRIIEKTGVPFNYRRRLGWLLAQKRTTDFFLAVGHKPELMIMECYYTQIGRIWSVHNHHIPVVELQHGVLNRNHYAYNPTYHSDLLYPDEICVYGEEEYKYFTEEEKQFVSIVSMTGLYILDRSVAFFSNDIFAEQRRKYKHIVVVAGQKGGEETLSAFVDDLAKRLPDVFFVYIPRHVIELSFTSSNVMLKVGVNIYEYLKWCDVHVTISSTTGLEAHFYRKPVIFCDFSNVAKEYYGGIIGETNGAFYIHDKEEFVKTFQEIQERQFVWRELFAHESELKMKDVMERYLGKESKKTK